MGEKDKNLLRFAAPNIAHTLLLVNEKQFRGRQSPKKKGRPVL
jgi:hypothetical protein